MSRSLRATSFLSLCFLLTSAACLEGDPNPYDQKESTGGTSASGGSTGIMPSDKCSQQTGISVMLTINNRTQRALRVMWVDYSCQENFFSDLLPGQSFIVATEASHPWRLRDAASNALVLEYLATNAATQSVDVTGL